MAGERIRTLVMPDLGAGVSEGRIGQIRVVVGQRVHENELLLEIETDKLMAEFPSPYPCQIEEILVSTGDTVAVGSPFARVAVSQDLSTADIGERRMDVRIALKMLSRIDAHELASRGIGGHTFFEFEKGLIESRTLAESLQLTSLGMLQEETEEQLRASLFSLTVLVGHIQSFDSHALGKLALSEFNRRHSELSAAFESTLQFFYRLTDKARRESGHAPLREQLALLNPMVAQSLARFSDLTESIFVVHGQSEMVLETVVDHLQKVTDRRPVVLHELPNKGMTVIQKIETHATRVSFAVIVMTPDDVGRLNKPNQKSHPRARQNVVFECGYFAGKLGLRNVAVLYEPSVELPSDLHGILYIRLDRDWRSALDRELKEAGILKRDVPPAR